MGASRTVLHHLAVRVLSSPYPDLVLAGRLAYDPSDPYAVFLGVAEVHPFEGGEPPVCWTFGRDLLDRGRREAAGEGDVLIAPAADGTLLIELHGSAGSAVLGVSGAQVGAFLDDAFAQVPAGAESGYLDLEDCLARLLV
ncbi:SsgA family sporulation/cell division regulator [Kitasatospora sp. NPDC002040]|uniref:SsgA family sporulation/cell division regulator n=1 Tax=Kitasatospora sp. NPDC002040 TaxID=3154661 RepID=UPI00331F9C02